MYVSVSKFRLSVAYRSNCILFSESRDPCVLCLIAGVKEARAEEWFEKLKRSTDPPVTNPPEWKAKNPDCLLIFEESRRKHRLRLESSGLVCEKVAQEEPEPDFWRNEIIPFHEAPDEVQTHVNTIVWRELTA